MKPINNRHCFSAREKTMNLTSMVYSATINYKLDFYDKLLPKTIKMYLESNLLLSFSLATSKSKYP